MFKLSMFAVFLLMPAPLLAQAAQPIPRASFIATMDGEFRKVDANKDGQLTSTEVEQFQRGAALAQVQANSRALFAALDADRNGQINPVEFAKLPMTPPRTNPAALMRFDSGRDGRVSLVEHRTATLANFDRMDADKDGVVNPAEMRAGGIAPR